jgi:hypothetical protein
MISGSTMKGRAVENMPRHGLVSLGAAAILCFSAIAFGQNIQPQPETPHAASAKTLENMPPQLPTVTLHNGDLTIVAYNSSLHDILEMVRAQTGATVDIPSDATERVFVNLGPGPTRKVLDLLLAGSSFNYILLGSETDPQALTKVLLSPKPTGNSESSAMAETTASGRQRREFPAARRPQAPSDEVEEQTAPIQQASESSTSTEGGAKAPAINPEAAKSEGQEKTEAAAEIGNQPGAGLQSAAGDQTSAPTEYPHTPNIKSAQEVLQDLYARRQAMQQQQQQRQSSPQ